MLLKGGTVLLSSLALLSASCTAWPMRRDEGYGGSPAADVLVEDVPSRGYDVVLVPPPGRGRVHHGELLAVDAEHLFLGPPPSETEQPLLVQLVRRDQVEEARFKLFAADEIALTLPTGIATFFVSIALYSSFGVTAVLSFFAIAASTLVNTIAAGTSSRVHVSGGGLAHLGSYARFPQGLPPSWAARVCGDALCAGGLQCVDGICLEPCGSGMVRCHFQCVSLDSDTSCGACDRICLPGAHCQAGICQLQCRAGRQDCGGRCVDVSEDTAHCGACGVRCADGEPCREGRCRASCPPGRARCGEACVDVASDGEHCGACGTRCADGELCEQARCVRTCPAGLTPCGPVCLKPRGEAPPARESCEAFGKAIDDARVAEPRERSSSLTPIRGDEPSLSWKGKRGRGRVLVVTWARDGYDPLVGKPAVADRTVPVTPFSEVQRRCREFTAAGLHGPSLTLRLEQLLGLAPSSGKTRLVELWLEPVDLFRACPDSEIDDRTCELAFPPTATEVYRSWFNQSREGAYGKNGLPWTRLGYTYDWGDASGNHVGASEYLVRKGALMEVKSSTATDDYCR